MVIFDIVSAWALTFIANDNPAIFSVAPCTERNIKFFTEKTIKFFYLNFLCPHNSNMLHVFKNNIYTNFKTA